MQKILVLRGGALGDFIVTLPALARLRQRWPAARIELAGNATAAELARSRGMLDTVHSQHEARWAALFSDAPLPAPFGSWLATFDLVVSYWPDPEGEMRRHFPLRKGQVFLSASAIPGRAPAAAHYGEPLRSLGLESGDLFVRLHPLVATSQTVAPRVSVGTVPPPPRSAPIAIHPGSGSPRKNWPLACWIELCRWIQRERYAELLIVSGEADVAAADALAGFGQSARRLPLEELMAQLFPCRLFLGHDSGVSHLAAACGVPCILLFGPTDPAMWAPPAPHVCVLQRGPDVSSIALSDVQQAIAAALADQS